MKRSLYGQMVERAAHKFNITVTTIKMRQRSIEHVEKLADAMALAGIAVEPGFDDSYLPVLRATVAIEEICAFAEKAGEVASSQVVRDSTADGQDVFMLVSLDFSSCMPVTRLVIEAI